jgi:hypothetical protein
MLHLPVWAFGSLAWALVFGWLYLRTRLRTFEALSVLSAIIHSTSLGFFLNRLVIYTDNMNTVHMFNSLSALPAYNDILKSAITLSSSVSFIYISGESNTVADALSHGQLHTVVDNVPGITIDTFSPPCIRRESGAVKLWFNRPSSPGNAIVLFGPENASSMNVL